MPATNKCQNSIKKKPHDLNIEMECFSHTLPKCGVIVLFTQTAIKTPQALGNRQQTAPQQDIQEHKPQRWTQGRCQGAAEPRDYCWPAILPTQDTDQEGRVRTYAEALSSGDTPVTSSFVPLL